MAMGLATPQGVVIPASRLSPLSERHGEEDNEGRRKKRQAATPIDGRSDAMPLRRFLSFLAAQSTSDTTSSHLMVSGPSTPSAASSVRLDAIDGASTSTLVRPAEPGEGEAIPLPLLNQVGQAALQRNQGRLPATVDASLAQQANTTRLAFVEALSRDQRAALQPHYQTSFRSAEDVVARLLPYHVYHVRDEDLLYVLEQGSTSSESGAGSSKRTSHSPLPAPTAAQAPTRSRRRRRQPLRTPLDLNRLVNRFPTEEETGTAWQRYCDIQTRAKRLRRALIGDGPDRSATTFYQESRYYLERMAWEQEREAFTNDHETLRLSREQAVNAGVPWKAILRAMDGETQSDSSSDEASEDPEDESSDDEENTTAVPDATNAQQADGIPAVTSGTNQNGASMSDAMPTIKPPIDAAVPSSSAVSSPAKATRPRGRPRKERDEHGNIIRPSQSVSSPDGGGGIDVSAHAYAATAAAAAAATTTATTSMSTTPAYAIPSQPIRLALPLATLPRLNELSITPLPSSHLLPAIAARQAAMAQGQDEVQSRAVLRHFDVAPRFPPTEPQSGPAQLVGISFAPFPSTYPTPSMPTAVEASGEMEMMHISLILSRLGPAQLSGLATLMQSVQRP